MHRQKDPNPCNERQPRPVMMAGGWRQLVVREMMELVGGIRDHWEGARSVVSAGRDGGHGWRQGEGQWLWVASGE